jgi:hypothetical protein
MPESRTYTFGDFTMRFEGEFAFQIGTDKVLPPAKAVTAVRGEKTAGEAAAYPEESQIRIRRLQFEYIKGRQYRHPISLPLLPNALPFVILMNS